MDLADLGPVVLIGAVVVLVAVLGVRLAGKLGVPGLLLYLVLGIVLGNAVPWIEFDNAQVATILGSSALIIILVQGGLTTRLSQLKPVLGPSIALASVGVIASIAVVALPLVLLGVELREALLLGTVLAATDAAAVFSVLRKLRISTRLRTVLEAEAGFNDAPVVVIVSVLVSDAFTTLPWWQIPFLIALELIGGALIGIGIGYFARWVLPRLALPAVGLYPIAVLAFAVAAYGVADLAHVSGFMAVYVASVIIGSSEGLPHRRSVTGFTDGMAWIAEIGLFIMLGMLSNVARLPEAIGIALFAGAALVFLGRPIAAAVSLLPFKFNWRETAFVGVAGLRGAVPIVFAAIPLGAAVAGAEEVFDATLIVVFVLLLIQPPLLPKVAKLLRIETADRSDELQFEIAPLDGMNAVVLGIDVPPESKLVGTFVVELGLPAGSVVSLVVRDGSAIAPDSDTRLRPGDRLVIITNARDRSATEKRLKQIAEHGRLASWRTEDS